MVVVVMMVVWCQQMLMLMILYYHHGVFLAFKDDVNGKKHNVTNGISAALNRSKKG